MRHQFNVIKLLPLSILYNTRIRRWSPKLSSGNNLDLSHKKSDVCVVKSSLNVDTMSNYAFREDKFHQCRQPYLLYETCRPGKCGHTQKRRFVTLIPPIEFKQLFIFFCCDARSTTREPQKRIIASLQSVYRFIPQSKVLYKDLRGPTWHLSNRIYIFINHLSVRNNDLFNSGL